MATENFTTYTEVDPNSRITVSASKIDFNLSRKEDAYVYKDFGAGFFGDFDILGEFEFTSGNATNETFLSTMWNAVDDFLALQNNAGENGVGMSARHQGATVDMRIENVSGTTRTIDVFTGSFGVRYYTRFKRVGTVGTVLIYSDAARTILLDTLSLTLNSTPLRYFYGVQSYNDGVTTAQMLGFTQNIDLQLPAGAGKFFFFFEKDE